MGKSALLALGLVLIFGSTSEALATFKDAQLPKLNLTGEANGYNEDFYPDGRVRVPQSNGTAREFLVPVFIENTWDPIESIDIVDNNPGPTNGQTILTVSPEEIYSFEFSLYYDSSAVRFVDVVSTGQIHNLIEENDVDDWYDPITSGWDLSVFTRPDDSYLSSLFPTPSAVDAGKGWKATITGVSSQPLPVTFGYEVLCYLKFEAVPDVSNPNTPATSLKTPIYIANDTIKYNGMNIITDHPFDKYAVIAQNAGSGALTQNDEYDSEYVRGNRRTPLFFQGSAENYTGTTGINNFDPVNPNNPEPTAPGVIYISYMDELPRILLSSDKGGSDNIQPVPEGTNSDEAEQFRLADPITVDASEQQPIEAERRLRVTNAVNNSRLRYLEIETDQEWLILEPVTITGSKTDGIFQISDRKIFVNYIDAGFLGNSVLTDPLNQITDDDGDLFLDIKADPTRINNRLDDEDTDPTDPEKAGKYVGHITFYSPDAEISPIELEITFIYFRIPQEACERAQSIPRGIKLNMRNSEGAVGERTSLIFGTGKRATGWESDQPGERGVDSLFGEFEYTAPGNGFWARFYPVDENGNVPQNYNLFGYGDWNPNVDNPRSGSRDIRSSEAIQKSIIYYVRFDANGVNNYPVVLDWDVRDFRVCDDENGDQQVGDLFLRDTANGQLFPSINMINGTVIDANRRSYTFQDPNISSFLIEYTLPNVIEFVDEEGNPIIKSGWNMLSLPVNPTNKKKGIVYADAISPAYIFSAKTYAPLTNDDNLSIGQGFFLKYGTDITTTFAGTTISEISIDRGFPVRLYPGDNGLGSWNLVGALSSPVSTENISFDEYNGRLADIDYTRQYGVWRYVPGMGYEEVSELRPGRGYWIKVDEDSYYRLEDGSNKKADESPLFATKEALRSSSAAIKVADMVGNNGQVFFNSNEKLDVTHFELPPSPGSNIFDVRFNSGKQLTNEIDDLISISGASYPVKISMENADTDYEFFSAVTGQELGRVRAGSSDVVTIINENMTLIGMRKVETANNQAVTVFPNPVAQTLNVNYTVETSSNVTIEIVNTIGNVVLTDSFSADAAGTRQLGVSNMVNGTYLVRIINGETTVVAPVTIAR